MEVGGRKGSLSTNRGSHQQRELSGKAEPVLMSLDLRMGEGGEGVPEFCFSKEL